MQRISNIETIKYLGKEAKVCGWVQSVRSHGKIIFIDLRDRSGLLQLVFIPNNEMVYNECQKLRPEWVIGVTGKVEKRPANMINPKIDTGSVELHPETLEIFSQAKTLPFAVDTAGYEISEEKRLKYRYLDLRRERMRKNLETRQKVIQYMREFLQNDGFVEVETPILTKSTAEGARDFIVPSRLQPGNFYALPQSPQQYKQLLMVGGLEKYFQIARCLRDEDPRADRQAEHTQLDIEVSFTSEEEILDLTEKLYVGIAKKLFPEKRIAKIPFPRMTYKDAMEKYNSDKPDMRRNKEDKDELAFCFVVDFPMFEYKQGDKRWGAMHHPFTKPKTDDIQKLKKEPEKILAHQYDFVLNGYEIGGGSIRNADSESLLAVFEVLGNKKQDVKKQFKYYFEAFGYGVPPHGGIAPGIDRFLAVVLGEPSIREVIAFPKTGDNRDLMMDAPSEVSPEQLTELHLKTTKSLSKAKKPIKK